jgi:hypothetical protein
MVKNRWTFIYYKGIQLFLATGTAVRDGPERSGAGTNFAGMHLNGFSGTFA